MDEKENSLDKKIKEEFRDRVDTYKSWRWSNVSFYQSIFIVFITSAILIFVDIIAEKDIPLKILIISILVLCSFILYLKMLSQTQKPIIVCENAIGTIEGKSVKVKGNDGEEYSIFRISDAHHGVNKAE